ncbi:hypothetical protein ACFY36_09665 [Actinoplanes sp. NPDC000266]
MTNPQVPGLPVAAELAAERTKEDVESSGNGEGGALVGASDAEADAARSGADADLADPARDSDGVAVGEADVEADKRRSGA